MHYGENEIVDLSKSWEKSTGIHKRQALLTPSAPSPFIQDESYGTDFEFVEIRNLVNSRIFGSRQIVKKFEKVYSFELVGCYVRSGIGKFTNYT